MEVRLSARCSVLQHCCYAKWELHLHHNKMSAYNKAVWSEQESLEACECELPVKCFQSESVLHITQCSLNGIQWHAPRRLNGLVFWCGPPALSHGHPSQQAPHPTFHRDFNNHNLLCSGKKRLIFLCSLVASPLCLHTCSAHPISPLLVFLLLSSSLCSSFWVFLSGCVISQFESKSAALW